MTHVDGEMAVCILTTADHQLSAAGVVAPVVLGAEAGVHACPVRAVGRAVAAAAVGAEAGSAAAVFGAEKPKDLEPRP